MTGQWGKLDWVWYRSVVGRRAEFLSGDGGSAEEFLIESNRGRKQKSFKLR
jgi:hypothetical protein